MLCWPLPQKPDFKKVPKFAPRASHGRVIRVVDGDTVWVIIREAFRLVKVCIRLHAIDTPELRSKDPAQRKQAQQAKEHMSGMVLNRVVRIKWYGADKYGRQLGGLWLGRKDVNAAMVQDGFAKNYDGGKRTPFVK
jgi:endonuclease YncB( thermonuclease family)